MVEVRFCEEYKYYFYLQLMFEFTQSDKLIKGEKYFVKRKKYMFIHSNGIIIMVYLMVTMIYLKDLVGLNL
jgi:hypothetical protein